MVMLFNTVLESVQYYSNTYDRVEGGQISYSLPDM